VDFLGLMSSLNMPVSVIVLILVIINHTRLDDFSKRLERFEKRFDTHINGGSK